MAEMYEYKETSHFTAGAVGEPGNRTFYLQAGDAFGFHSVKLEKQQVSALATFLRTVLEDLPSPTTEPAVVPLIEPAQPAFVVGQIAVGINEADGEVVLVVEELVPVDEDEEEEDPTDPLFETSMGAEMRVHISVNQAAAFIYNSDLLMEKGRPPCRLCGSPLDPGGHACPRLN